MMSKLVYSTSSSTSPQLQFSLLPLWILIILGYQYMYFGLFHISSVTKQSQETELQTEVQTSLPCMEWGPSRDSSHLVRIGGDRARGKTTNSVSQAGVRIGNRTTTQAWWSSRKFSQHLRTARYRHICSITQVLWSQELSSMKPMGPQAEAAWVEAWVRLIRATKGFWCPQGCDFCNRTNRAWNMRELLSCNSSLSSCSTHLSTRWLKEKITWGIGKVCRSILNFEAVVAMKIVNVCVQLSPFINPVVYITKPSYTHTQLNRRDTFTAFPTACSV